MATETYEFNCDYELTEADNVLLFIENEIDNFIYIDTENQIEVIIYYVNLYYDYNIDIDDPIHTEFISKIIDNCYLAYNQHNYPPFEKGESEMSYIQELFEVQSISMITSVIKDFRENQHL